MSMNFFPSLQPAHHPRWLNAKTTPGHPGNELLINKPFRSTLKAYRG